MAHPRERLGIIEAVDVLLHREESGVPPPSVRLAPGGSVVLPTIGAGMRREGARFP
jgi:hypothetical protein